MDDAAGGAESPSYIGAHFITLVSRERRLLFGQVTDGRAVLSQAGRILVEEWHRLPELAQGELVVMPNHLHAIVRPVGVKGKKGRRGGGRRRPSEAAVLGAAIARLKAAVTRRVSALPGAGAGSIWQPGYRDLVIEDARELAAIRRLLREDPQRWAQDVENPDRQDAAPAAAPLHTERG